MRVLVILNEHAGTARKGGDDGPRHMLKDLFARHGIEAAILPVKGREIAARLRAALGTDGADLDVVVAGGGDGTVSAVAGVLAGTAMPLGVVPLGTLNHFARDLAVPGDLDEAVALIAAGRIRRVDVAEVGGHVFLNNSAIGFYPRMVADRERQEQGTGRGKWLAMVLATLRTLYRFPRHHLIVSIGDRRRVYRTGFAFVGNNFYPPTLRGFGRRETLDAGELCLYVVSDDRRWSMVTLGLRALFGRIDQARDFQMFRGLRRIEIDAPVRLFAVAADGQVLRLPPPLRYRIRPQALRVIVP